MSVVANYRMWRGKYQTLGGLKNVLVEPSSTVVVVLSLTTSHLGFIEAEGQPPS